MSAIRNWSKDSSKNIFFSQWMSLTELLFFQQSTRRFESKTRCRTFVSSTGISWHSCSKHSTNLWQWFQSTRLVNLFIEFLFYFLIFRRKRIQTCYWFGLLRMWFLFQRKFTIHSIWLINEVLHLGISWLFDGIYQRFNKITIVPSITRQSKSLFELFD